MPVRECNAWYTNCEVVDEVGVVFFQLQSIPHSHRNNLNKHKIYAKQCVVKKCQKTGIKIGKRWHFGGKYPSWEMSTISSMWFFSIHFNSVHRPLWLAIQTEDPVQLLKNWGIHTTTPHHTVLKEFPMDLSWTCVLVDIQEASALIIHKEMWNCLALFCCHFD